MAGNLSARSAPRPGNTDADRCPRWILCATALASLAFALLSYSASRIWFTPDSAGYLTVAGRLLDHGDINHPISQLRLPGYPLLLAAVFRTFGAHSGDALMILQHLMVIACNVMAVAIAWTVRPSAWFAASVGILCAFGLHLSAYANAVLTEVPYALALLALLYMLIRFVQSDQRRWIIGASLAAGVAALIKDAGQAMIWLCVAAVFARSFMLRWMQCNGGMATPRPKRQWHTACAHMVATVACAYVPAWLLLLPVQLHHYNDCGRFATNFNRGLIFYHRAGFLSRHEVPGSDAVARIRAAVESAKKRGFIPEGASHHDFLAAVISCEMLFAPPGPIYESGQLHLVADLMARAARDAFLAYPLSMIRDAVADAYLMYMIPPRGHRMLPGAATALNNRPADVVLYASDTYTTFVAERFGTDRLQRYLAPGNEPNRLTGVWSRWVTWYVQTIERGKPIVGLLDTPHEEFVLLAGLGSLCALATRRRALWLLITLVTLYHGAGAAAFGGVQPRYVVPVHPLMNMLALLPCLLVMEFVASRLRAAPRKCARDKSAIALENADEMRTAHQFP